MPIQYLWLLPLGLVIGAFGTLIGAGGGFILVPVLLLVYPQEKTELITGISLAVVFFNALSGSAAYARMKRIDYQSGAIFAVATVPGAILGAISTAYLRRGVFDLIFGILMIVAGIYLWTSHKDERRMASPHETHVASNPRRSFWSKRDLVDADGEHYHYEFNPNIGIVLSIFVGFLSSLLGVGGGFIHVPILVRLLKESFETILYSLEMWALSFRLFHLASVVLLSDSAFPRRQGVHTARIGKTKAGRRPAVQIVS